MDFLEMLARGQCIIFDTVDISVAAAPLVFLEHSLL